MRLTSQKGVHLEAGVKENVNRRRVVVLPLEILYLPFKLLRVVLPTTHVEDSIVVVVVVFEEVCDLYQITRLTR